MQTDAGVALAEARKELAAKVIAADAAARGDPLAAEQPVEKSAAYQALFPETSAALRSALACVARADMEGGALAARRACEAWDAAAADGALQVEMQGRKLCADHGLRAQEP